MGSRQGQGVNTHHKEFGFRLLFRQNLLITTSEKLRDRIYWHLDMHAGCGWNHESDCPGSPLVFMEEAVDVGRPFQAIFCDRDRKATDELGKRLAFSNEQTDSSSVGVFTGNNADALRLFAQAIASEDRPEYAIGSLLIDPNGFKEDDSVPLSAIKKFLESHNRIDVIVNINLSFFSLVRGCKRTGQASFLGHPDPEDVLGLRKLKKKWLVRSPAYCQRDMRFAIAFGRNTDVGMKGFEEFYPIDSVQGYEILHGLRRVNPKQPLLFN